MKKKLFMIFIFIFIVSSVCVGTLIIKETYSVEETVAVTFDYSLNVDETNKIIKYLNHNLTVGELKKKIDTSKLKDPNIKVIEKDKNDTWVEEIDGDKFSTGSILEIYDEGTRIAWYTLSVLGDFTGGDEINENDAIELFKYYRDSETIDSKTNEGKVKLLAGNVKFDSGNISTESNIELTVGDRYVMDYVVYPEEEPNITLADIAKLYQYQQGKITKLEHYAPKQSVTWSVENVSTDHTGETITALELITPATGENSVVSAKIGGKAKAAFELSGTKYETDIVVKNPNKILSNQFLITDGNKIIRTTDKSKTAIQLRGYNVGSWLSISNTFLPLQSQPECKFNDKCTDLENCPDCAPVRQNDIDSINMYSCINSEYIDQAIYKNLGYLSNWAFKNEKPLFTSKADYYNTTKNLRKTLYENYMTEKDFDMIAQTGANVIRLPIEFSLFYQDYDKDGKYETKSDGEFADALAQIKNAVKMAADRGIYTILDLHVAPGRQNDGGYCGNGTFLNDSEISEYNRERMVALWGYLAKHFYNEPAIAGYDLLNEPQGNLSTTPEKYKTLIAFYDAAYKKIRDAEDDADPDDKYPNHIVIMEETCVYCGATHTNIYGEKISDYFIDTEVEAFNKKQEERNNFEYMVGALPNPNDKEWTNVVYSTHDYVEDVNPNGNGKSIASVKDENLQKEYEDEQIKRFDQKFIREVYKIVYTYDIPLFVGEFSFLGDNESWDTAKSVWEHGFKRYSGDLDDIEDDYKLDLDGDGKYVKDENGKYVKDENDNYVKKTDEGAETQINIKEFKDKIQDSNKDKAIKDIIKESISYTAWNYKGHFEPHWALVYWGTRQDLYIDKEDINKSIEEGLIKENYILSLTDNGDINKYHAIRDQKTGLLGTLNEQDLYKVYNGDKKSAGGFIHKVNLETDSKSVIEEVFSYKSSDAMKFNKNFYDVFIDNIGNDRIAKNVTITSLDSDKLESPKKTGCDLTLKVGESTYLNYKVEESKAVNKGNAIWTSADPSVLTIDENTGKITAKKSGDAATVTLNIPAYEYTVDDTNRLATDTIKICVVDK